ncbi:MAG: sulfotransferase family 2 domain-containing protein [Paracoccaceae bacterium]
MPLARVRNTVLYFAHIPKTGGTSVEAYLRKIGTVCLVSRRCSGHGGVTPQHMEREAFDEFVPLGFYDYGFAILRDPMARLQSEFRHQMWLSGKRSRLARCLSVGVSKRRAEISGFAAERFVRLGDFDPWVAAILQTCVAVPTVCDNHIRPQVDFVHPAHKLFDFERGIDPVLRWIDQVTGVKGAAVPHEKKGVGLKIVPSGKTRTLVARFYREDYALLEVMRDGKQKGGQKKGAASAAPELVFD